MHVCARVLLLSGLGDTAGVLELSSLTSATGVTIHGVATLDYSGYDVSGAGDVNGDGLDDILIGAWKAEPNGYYSGTTYLVYGSSTGTSPRDTRACAHAYSLRILICFLSLSVPYVAQGVVYIGKICSCSVRGAGWRGEREARGSVLNVCDLMYI